MSDYKLIRTMRQSATWSSIIARGILLVLLIGSFYGLIYPDHLGMTKSTAQIVNAIYLATSLAIQIMEGRSKP